jgi:type I restriction-modification system DNA methylase subunit
MSKKQFGRNKEIATMIANGEKMILAGKTISEQAANTIQEYTGAGGLIKEGANERGILYEYYTPYPIIEAMWALAYKHGFTSGHILEPSCGVGRFLRYVDPTLNTVDAYEFSKDNNTSYLIAKACFPWANITFNYFESIFYEGNKRVGAKPKYDLVIGNPPYGKFSGLYASNAREGKHFSAKTYDQYFIQAGLTLLKPDGLLVFIVPSTFLQSGGHEKAKKEITEIAKLVDAYRLPEGMFDKTGIMTDIVVFKKKTV